MYAHRDAAVNSSYYSDDARSRGFVHMRNNAAHPPWACKPGIELAAHASRVPRYLARPLIARSSGR